MPPTEIEPQEKTLTISAEGSERHEFIKKLAQKVRQDDDDRQVWKDKQVVAYNARLGLRRRTNRPYPGASEVPIPITDKFITKLKSMFVSVATLMKKQIIVTLEDGEVATPETKLSAERIERALNNLIRKRDFSWAKKVTLFVDYFLENGHAVFKIIEKFFYKTINRSINVEDNYSKEDIKLLKSLKKSDLRMILAQREEMDLNDEDDVKEIDKAIEQFKSGKKVLTFTKKDIHSEPTVIPERGLRIIVPSSGTDTQRLPRICHDMWMTYQELREKADKGIYDKKTVESLDEESGSTDDNLTNTSWATSEGVSTLDVRGGLFNVRECQTWYKNEKWVFTWIEQDGINVDGKDDGAKDIKVLQEMKLPYSHGLWTYVKHDYEMKNTRWYSSRGVPEKIRGLHQTIEKMYNARLIRDEYNNAPMWRVSKQLGMAGFYPKDDTPGCTAEACAFRDQYEDFKQAGAEVIGISSDAPGRHAQFAGKHRLPFVLLSDQDGAVRKAYGVAATLGILPGRVTFVIDRDGIIRHVFSSQLRATRHVAEAIEILRKLT